MAELFEIYTTKLLTRNFPDWTVHFPSPKIWLYEGRFFARHIIPDIVMERGDETMVFDTKYKRMNYVGSDNRSMGDLDWTDFFQIHTYIGYYKSINKQVITGGLLYPLSQKFDENKCYSDRVFEDNSAKFIVDGIEVLEDLADTAKNESLAIDNIVNAETEFCDRIRKIADRVESN